MLKVNKKRWSYTFIMTIICISIVFLSTTQALLAESNNNESASKYFRIRVIDSETKRGIPLVELKTNNDIIYQTDSAGYVAFYESGLMNRDVFFHVQSHGYSYFNDSLGTAGVILKTIPGKESVIEMDRINIAERLYRITGQGIYRDSELLGLSVPTKNPNLNGRVVGQDSNHAIVYNGKIYWFWGDTSGTWHPLGNFRTTGATSDLPKNGGLDPEKGVDLNYFTRKDGFVREMVPKLPGDPNLVWVSALMTVPDDTGKEWMVTGYSSLHGLGSEVASGILIWNDKDEAFSERIPFPMDKRWKHPDGMAAKYEDNGKEYWIFARPLPVIRVPAELDAVKDIDKYEAFTCLKPGTEFKGKNTELNRDETGKLIWEWRTDTKPISQEEERELLKYGLITEDEARFQLKDIDTGKDVIKHEGSIQWNEYRGMWNMITSEQWGTSFLGEIWYAEAPSPTGPWKYAKKIITHNDYDFYNPIQHTFFTKDNGRVLYFEGTYTASFGGDLKTPRYEYNQVMYKLDLDDPRLQPLLEKSYEGRTPWEKPTPVETGNDTDVPTETQETGTGEGKDTPGTGDKHIWFAAVLVFIGLALAATAFYLKPGRKWGK